VGSGSGTEVVSVRGRNISDHLNTTKVFLFTDETVTAKHEFRRGTALEKIWKYGGRKIELGFV
jgi:hypothetical protein